MRYLVSIHHPAQVHFFRHVIVDLEAAGHDILVCVRDKEVAVDLLEAHGIDHEVLAETPDGGLPRLAAMQLRYEYRLLRRARAFRPDVMTSIGGVEIAHVAPLVGARSVAFDDSEPTPAHAVSAPLLDVVCTPAAYDGDFGAGHRRYEGYHELAYLHPDRFEPDGDALRDHGVDPDETYTVCRFVAWDAHHDVGQDGLSRQGKRELVATLADHGEVYVSSEGALPSSLSAHELPVPPHLAHDLLAFADCYVGDSGTMATEAAVLGTPAVRATPFEPDEELSNFVELETEYGLLSALGDEAAVRERVEELLTDPSVADAWRERRERLLADKVDVTEFAVTVLDEEGRTARASAPRPARSAVAGVRQRLFGGESE